MNESDNSAVIDWSLTTWEGARREQHRRWASLSLREVVLALEEMHALAERLSSCSNEGITPARSPVVQL
jgi:hypothetical protein